jgi:hypothetical protein
LKSLTINNQKSCEFFEVQKVFVVLFVKLMNVTKLKLVLNKCGEEVWEIEFGAFEI